MSDSPSTPVIPDHNLIRRIGEGSYGEIWLARNVIGIYRAVKIIYRRTFNDARPYEREFSGIKKFEPISRTHPALMDILQVGRNETEGYFYYVMEVADDLTSGQQFHPDTYLPNTLSKQLSSRGALPFDECLQLGLSLADGLAHLHQHGLIHRDIKPSNIIFVNGRAKLADIGLVADISAARTYVGTEGFIPPEGPGTVQADIYSLGKVLYEASTGKDRHAFPEWPTLLEHAPERLPMGELNEIVVKACANLPKERHASAGELHGELQMLIGGKSVKRLRLLERRLTRVTRLAAVSAAVAILAGGVIYLINSARQRERNLLAASYVTTGTAKTEGNNLHGGLPDFTEALRLQDDDGKTTEAHRIRIDSILRHAPSLLRTWNETGAVKDLQFTLDGRRLLVASGSRAVLRDAASGEVLPLNCAPAGDIETVAFSPDEKRIVVAFAANVWIGDGSTGMKALPVPGSGKVWGARFSPDGSRIVVARADRCAYVVDLTTGQSIQLDGHTGEVIRAAFSPDGRRIVTSSKDSTARVWDALTGKSVLAPLRHGNWVYDAMFSPDGQRIVTASFDAIQLWDAASGKPASRPMEDKQGFRRAQFSPDQRFIASAGWDQRVGIWSSKGKLALPWLNHERPVMHALFAPDGRRLATCDDSGVVKIWDLEVEPPKDLGRAVVSEDGLRYITFTNLSWRLWNAKSDTPVGVPVTVASPIDALRVNRDATRVAVISGVPREKNDRTDVSVFDAESGAMLTSLVITQQPHVMALSADGKRFAAARRDIWVWNLEAGPSNTPPLLLGNAEPVKCIAFSPDGARMAVAAGNEVHLWDVRTGTPLRDSLPHDRSVEIARFSRDGARLLTACREGGTLPCSAQIWDLKTGFIVGGPFQHRDGIHAADFSADERMLATGAEDDSATIWRVADGEMIATDLELPDKVSSVRFSRDGAWLITSSGTFCRVWETAHGQALTPLLAHDRLVQEAGFFPEADRFWVKLSDGRIVVWPLGRSAVSIEELRGTALDLGVSGPRFRGRNSSGGPKVSDRVSRTLRAQFESRLERFASDLPAWHERQAAACEREKNWFGARFHLGRLLKDRPEDAELTARYEIAAARCEDAEKEKP